MPISDQHTVRAYDEELGKLADTLARMSGLAGCRQGSITKIG